MFRRKYLFGWPTFGDASLQCGVAYPKSSCPLSQAMGFSVVCQEPCLASVLALLHGCRPLAIGFPAVCNAFIAMSARIIAVIVYAFDAVFAGRLLSHVSQKVRKRSAPPVAHANISFAIPVVASVVGVIASRLHFLPGAVFCGFVASSLSAAKAAARLSRSFAELSSSHDGRVSALALTQPARIAASGFSSKLKNRQFVVLISRLVRSMLAASTGRDFARSDSATANNLLSAAFAAKKPVGSSLATKIASGVTDCLEFSEWLSSDVFDAIRQLGRITSRHIQLLTSWIMDRAESVPTTASARFILA